MTQGEQAQAKPPPTWRSNFPAVALRGKPRTPYLFRANHRLDIGNDAPPISSLINPRGRGLYHGHGMRMGHFHRIVALGILSACTFGVSPHYKHLRYCTLTYDTIMSTTITTTRSSKDTTSSSSLTSLLNNPLRAHRVSPITHYFIVGLYIPLG